MSCLLIYPTIDFLLYDIAIGLGQSDRKIDENFDRFWQKIELNDPNRDSVLSLVRKGQKVVSLLPDNHTKELNDAPYDGWLLPLRIDDTFALQVNCTSMPDPSDQFKPQEPTCFQLIKERIERQIGASHGSIGQTYFAWGKLSEPDQDATTTAQACYEALLLNTSNPTYEWHRAYIGSGTFLGAQWFELNVNSASNIHLVVLLFPHSMDMSDIGATITGLNKQLIHLFLFRHKVLASYNQSRKIEGELLKASQTLRVTSQSLSEENNKATIDLDNLQNYLTLNLQLLPAYSYEYTTLEQYKYSLQINLTNYQKRHKTIKALDPTHGESFLSEFVNFAEDKYLRQLEFDCDFFAPAQQIIENTIRTIEGIIQIEQAKSDRHLRDEMLKQEKKEREREMERERDREIDRKRHQELNSNLAIFGGGLTTGAISSSIILAKYPITEQKPNQQPQIDFILTAHFLLSMGAGISASLIIWLVSKLCMNPKMIWEKFSEFFTSKSSKAVSYLIKPTSCEIKKRDDV